MTTIQFPGSPTLNQGYTYGSRSWYWDGTGWRLATSVGGVWAGGSINNRAYTIPTSVTFTAAPTFDASLSNVFYFGAMTGNVTGVTINSPADGQSIIIRFVQDATGGRTVTLPTTIKASSAPDLGASRVSLLSLIYVSSASRWEGSWIVVPA